MDNIDTHAHLLNVTADIIPDLKNFNSDLDLDLDTIIPKSNLPNIYLDLKTEWEIIDCIWETKALKNSVFWSKKTDGSHPVAEGGWAYIDNNSGKTKKRNDTIEKIRNCEEGYRGYRFIKRVRGVSYEDGGYYGYKSKYHKELFLEIVTSLGLDRKPEIQEKQKDVYDTDGFYHKVSTPKEKLAAERYIKEIDPKDIEENQVLELGGMEVEL